MVRIEPWLQFAKSAEKYRKMEKIAKLRHKDIKSKAAKVQARQETEKKVAKRRGRDSASGGLQLGQVSLAFASFSTAAMEH